MGNRSRYREKLSVRKRAPRPWPDDRGRGVEAVKWQVWIGHQLREWRRKARRAGDPTSGLHLKHVKDYVALLEDRVSRIESGERRLEAVELLALAEAYGRGTKDIAALFAPPTPDQWAQIYKARVQDPRFIKPPGARPALPPGLKGEKTTGAGRTRTAGDASAGHGASGAPSRPSRHRPG